MSSRRPQLCLFVYLHSSKVAEGNRAAPSSKAHGCSCHWYGGMAMPSAGLEISDIINTYGRLGKAPGQGWCLQSFYQEVMVSSLFLSGIVQKTAADQSNPTWPTEISFLHRHLDEHHPGFSSCSGEHTHFPELFETGCNKHATVKVLNVQKAFKSNGGDSERCCVWSKEKKWGDMGKQSRKKLSSICPDLLE